AAPRRGYGKRHGDRGGDAQAVRHPRLEVRRPGTQHGARGGRRLRAERGARRREGVALLIVQKVGGTSVEDASALMRLVGIVAAAQSERPLVVVSAMGKTTDRLLEVLEAAMAGQDAVAQRVLSAIRARTEEAARPLLGERAEPALGEVDELFTSLENMAK